MKASPILLLVIAAWMAAISVSAEEALGLQGKSVSVLPVYLDVEQRPAGEDIAVRIAEVLGLMLENAGMTNVQVAAAGWFPGLGSIADEFAAHIKGTSWPTDLALWVHFAGVDRLSQIDFVLCDGSGNVLTQGSSELGTEDPNDPMHACMYVVQALKQRSDLGDPATPPETEGRMARTMRERSGLPPSAELEAAGARLSGLRGTWKDACAVYPVRVAGPDKAKPREARTLAKRLEAAGLGKPVAVDAEMDLKVPGDPNQMKVLWDTARAFREYLRAHPADQPYALLVECGPIPDVRYVHLFLCTRDGEWVVVDMQNNHHEDFQQIAPSSVKDCIDLAVRRLQHRIEGEAPAGK